MSSVPVIYHNPRCSKSRATLALLQEQGITPTIILYLDAPPTASDLANTLKLLGMTPPQLIRFGEDRAEELGITAQDTRSDSEWLALMAANPILIERPVVIYRNRALVCRPPERVLELLGRV